MVFDWDPTDFLETDFLSFSVLDGSDFLDLLQFEAGWGDKESILFFPALG